MTSPVHGTDVRAAILGGAVSAGVFVAALTELLGAFGMLTVPWMAAGWAVGLGAAATTIGYARGRGRWRGRAGLSPLPRGLEWAMAGWIGVIVAVTLVLACFSVPITYDSMTYHLARVAHWAQNRTVDFYPTHIVRQLYMPPWAEYALLHLFVLGGGDRLVNLVQWSSMVASLVGVTVIARELGAARSGQILSAFVCATIPMGILQAATTQNDYVSALWLVCLVSALLALERRPGPLPVLVAGASLGLAVLTKGTTSVLAAPFAVVFVFRGVNRTLAQKFGHGLVIALCAMALNAPHFVRNFDLFRSPLGPGAEGGYRYANDAFWPTIVASNVLRNVGLHLGTPSRAVNAAVERAIDGAHAAMGIAPDDPRSTWPMTRLWITPPRAHEDVTGNGLHLVLISAGLIGVWRLRANRRLVAFAGCLVAAFLLFCLVVRWQPWHSRLHLPLFVLGAPLIGVVFERLRPAVLAVVLVALAVSSAYFLTQSPDRPLTGRRSVMRKTWTEQRLLHAGAPYVDAARFVVSIGCHDVGLALGGNDREYFLWALMADHGWRGTLQPVAIGNVSARLPYPGRAIEPCAIVREGTAVSPQLTLGTQYYRQTWTRGLVQILTPAPHPVFSADTRTGPPAVSLLLRSSRFRPGDRMAVGLRARNPLGGAAADVYVGIVLPGGQSAAFVDPSGRLSDAVSLADAASFPAALAAPPGFTMSHDAFLDLTVPKGALPGTYQVFAALVKRRTPRAGTIPVEDFLASDIQAIVVFP